MIFYLLAGTVAALLFTKREDIADTIEENLDSWTQYDALFKKYSVGAPPDFWKWLKAISLNESSLGQAASVLLGIQNPDDVEGSKSSDGKSWGLMQVTLTTARDIDPTATPQKLNDPEYSIKLASTYLLKLARRFSQADPRYLEWVVKSYNQGPGNTDKERAGTIDGYAEEYWERFQRNLNRVNGG